MRDPFDEAEKHSPRFRDTYSLRRILAKEIRMNGEVERSQRRGYFAGAQSSDRVVPAETVKQDCEFDERSTQTAILEKVELRNIDLVSLPSSQCTAVHFHLRVTVTTRLLLFSCHAADRIAYETIVT